MKINLRIGEARCPIEVRRGALEKAGPFVKRAVSGLTSAVVLCDERTRRYAYRVLASLRKSRIDATLLAVPASEAGKTPDTLHRLWNDLAARGLDRHGCVLIVGGGVLGDLAGFAAATYMRGIACVQVPTTLLAQVDAAIGGKTAVNLEAGKNLAGTFTQPRGILIDPDVLRTLSKRDYSTGMAEVIKYGVIRDASLFSRLGRSVDGLLRRDRELLESIVGRCAAIKADVVKKDERESELRMILNYGHTVGHALERATGYRMTHGEAVGVGMAAEARIAQRRGLAAGSFVQEQDDLIEAVGLPLRTTLPGGADERFFAALRMDKKAKGGQVRFVLPRGPGKVEFPVAVDEAEVEAVLPEILH